MTGRYNFELSQEMSTLTSLRFLLHDVMGGTLTDGEDDGKYSHGEGDGDREETG